MRSFIYLFILSGRGGLLLVNTPLVARARAESLRASDMQPCWPFHVVVRTDAQAFSSYSFRCSKFLMLG